MNELAPRLTNDGKAYIIGAMNGDGITFTKMVIGNGVPVAGATPSMVGPQIEIGFTKIEVHDDYCILTGSFDNSEVEEGFYIYEIGVFAKNTSEQEVLYAYRYMNTNVDFVPAADSGNVLETEISIVVSIGDADNVTAVLIEGSLYANKQAFEDHLADHSNPHRVTKDQVGLDKVENNYFYENAITVDNPTEVQDNVATDDTLREAMSKIWYWIDQLINGGFIPTSGFGDVLGNGNNTGVTGDIWFADKGNNQPSIIGGRVSRGDLWRIMGAGGDSNVNPSPSSDGSDLDSGYLELATGDNGTEPIIVRQYKSNDQNPNSNNNFDNVARTLFLLDSFGDTSIPGNLWMEEPTVKRNYDKMIGGTQSGNDFVVIRFGANTSLNPGNNNNDGTAFLEFAVGDDAVTPYAEPIIATQYSGSYNPKKNGFGTAQRRAYILNGAGNTVFPGTCTAKSHPTSSDLKKKDVHGKVDLSTAEALIMGLQPIFYNFKGQWKESAGFGAQDVYKLTRELQLHDNGIYRATKMPEPEEIAEGVEYHDSDIEAHDDSEIEWNLNYTEFIPYLVRVVQEQQKRIEKLEAMLGGEN